jgi:glycosyltransferase involved in cell wall biosynthesis
MTPGRKRVLLVSNTVMHYRVSVYNFFWQEFGREGWDFEVLTNRMQPQNQNPPSFPVEEVPFRFDLYRRAILERRPDVVILFLHLKNPVFWPLLHWLKWKRIPFANWTKTRNLDDPDNPVRNALFNYTHRLSDALILYAADLVKYVSESQRHKIFTANNTINFHDFPEIRESKDEIKRDLDIPYDKVVLFAGRMNVDNGRKRVDRLIEVFRDVGGRNAGAVIVGTGMQEQWRHRMNPGTTRYLGEIHDPENRQISRIFKMADLFCIPGHIGLGISQAFYWGLPAVTMEGRQPPEIGYLKSGRNGFLVPQDDVSQLREKVFYLLDNDDVRESFGRNARADILKNGSVEGMFRGFLDCARYLEGCKA